MITINLLPEEYKKEYAFEKARRFSVLIFLSLYFIIIVFTALLFGVAAFLKIETNFWSNKIESEKSTEKVQQVLSLEESIRNINKKISIIKKADKESVNIVSILNNLSNIMNEDMYLKTLTINSETKNVNMEGFSSTRDDVLNLEEALRKSEWIDAETLVSPNSNILKEKDINFSFAFKIK